MTQTNDRLPLVLLATGAAIVVGIGVAGQALLPAADADWTNLVVSGPLTWAFLEALAFGRRRSANADQERLYLRYIGAIIFLFLILEAGPVLAIGAGWLDAAWAPRLVRTQGVLIGVALAVGGNFLPKLMSPWTLDQEPFDWQRVRRFGGWLAVLAGVVTAAAWATRPEETARGVTAVAVGAVLALTLAYKLVSRVAYALRKRRAAA
ncbi:MAG: hypothetical protein WEB90_07810 [Gemmatimonadota bacterium]